MGTQRGTSSNTFVRLNVKYGEVQRMIPVDISWTARDLKAKCAEVFGIHDLYSVNIMLLSRGFSIPDDASLGNYDFGDASRISLVITDIPPAERVYPDLPPSQVRRTIYMFYVYCGDCQELRPAKLRVYCNACGDPAFQLSEPPEDLDAPGKGKCFNQSKRCPSTQARIQLECNAQVNSQGEEGPHYVVNLPLVNDNYDDVPCPVCFTVEKTILRFPCCPEGGNHLMCLDCFKLECETHLNEGKFRLVQNLFTIACPCLQSYIPSHNYFRICGSNFYARYKTRGEKCALKEKGAVFCPQCELARIPTDDRRVLCDPKAGGCGFQFCCRCQREYHEVGDCEKAARSRVGSQAQQREIERKAALDKAFIKNNTKECPKCHTNTQKTTGCNHMTCSVCRLEYCWLCLIQWNMDCQSDHWLRPSVHGPRLFAPFMALFGGL